MKHPSPEVYLFALTASTRSTADNCSRLSPSVYFYHFAKSLNIVSATKVRKAAAVACTYISVMHIDYGIIMYYNV